MQGRHSQKFTMAESGHFDLRFLKLEDDVETFALNQENAGTKKKSNRLGYSRDKFRGDVHFTLIINHSQTLRCRIAIIEIDAEI